MESTRAARTNFRTTSRWNSVPIPPRVAERAYTSVEKRDDGCWISTYSVASHGYSQIGWQNRGARHVVLGHRAAWVHANGQVPLGMTLDHICKERRCVNPNHLRMLPNFENARRTNGMDWGIGACANGHSAEHLRQIASRKSKSGKKRAGLGCSLCYQLYTARSNWRTRHPGRPMPEHLLLATERKAA